MVQGKPGFFETIGGIFDPGGDPGAIHAAADSTRALAAQLTHRSHVLHSTRLSLLGGWAHGEGRDAYRVVGLQFERDLRDYTAELSHAAKVMDDLAEVIADARRKAEHFYTLAKAAVCLGLAMAIGSFCLSAASSAAALAVIEADFMMMIRGVVAALIERGLLMAAIRGALLTVAKRMFIGATVTIGVTMAVKGANDLNPLDPANWTIEDANNVLLGAILTGGMLQTSKIFKFGPFKAGAIGGGLGSGLMQFFVDGKPITDMKAWKNVGLSMGVSSLAGAALGKAGGALSGPVGKASLKLRGQRPFGAPIAGLDKPFVNRFFGPNGYPGRVGLDGWVKTGTGLPSGAAFYVINLGDGAKNRVPVLRPPRHAPAAPNVHLTKPISAGRSVKFPSIVVPVSAG